MNIIYYSESMQIEINRGKRHMRHAQKKPGQASIVHSQWTHRDSLILSATVYMTTLAKSCQPRKLNHVSLGIQGFFCFLFFFEGGGVSDMYTCNICVTDLSYSDSIIPPLTHTREDIHCKSCC